MLTKVIPPPLTILFLYAVLGPVDPARDIETLNEDNESEFVDDSECDQSEQPLSLGFEQNTSIPCLNPLDSGSEDYRFNTG